MKRQPLKKQKAPSDTTTVPSKELFGDFMKKEIFEQGDYLSDVISKYCKAQRINFDFLKIKLDKIHRVYITCDMELFGCAIAGAYNFEVLCDLISVPYLISEFNFANPILDKNTLVILLAKNASDKCSIEAKKRCTSAGARLIEIYSNGKASKKGEHGIYLEGEIYSRFALSEYTKIYLVLCLLALYFGEKGRVVTQLYLSVALRTLFSLPTKMKSTCSWEWQIKQLIGLIGERELLFTGKNVDFSTAVYSCAGVNFLTDKRASAVPLGELKFHSINNTVLVAFISSRGLLSESIEEIRKCTCEVIIVAPQGLFEELKGFKNVILYDESIPLFNPLLASSISQLLFYNISKEADNEK